MTCAENVGRQETIAGEMKQRQPIRKISLKRLKQLSGKDISLYHNSTIRREPCNATIAENNSRFIPQEKIISLQDLKDLPSAKITSKPAITNSKTNFGKQRKPVNKQSAKQKARLQRLAAIRQRWWNEAQSRGETLICGICDEGIYTFEDLTSDHIEPGNPRGDSEENLQPANQLCNQLKGSRRNFKIKRGDHNWRLIHGLL